MKTFFLFLLTIILAFFACSHGFKKSNGEETQIRIPAEAIQALNSEKDLDILIEKIGDSRIVMLGESSHGTSEFYTWRATISKKLIREKKFKIIAVEADWGDAYPVNRHIKGYDQISSRQVLDNFDRWPQWMWKNEETADLVEWLHTWNSQRPGEEETGFYGLDVYGLWESLDNVYEKLLTDNPAAAVKAKTVIDCFKPYNQDEQKYARATLNNKDCANELKNLLSVVQNHVASTPGNEEALNLLINTWVVVNAEKYYRTAIRNSNASWNIRDRHMSHTLNLLLEHYGSDSKIIIWEHNTHVGDARATDMAAVGMVNVGQLERERHGNENVYIVGFGTNRGKVLAAPSWGTKVRAMNVPPGRKNSWEWILQQHEPPDKIIFMEPVRNVDYFKRSIGHRAIGVVYDPSSEAGNYVPSIIPERYDAFIFFDKTTALKPLP